MIHLRRRLSLLGIVAVVIFLLADLLHVAEENRNLSRTLTETNGNIVRKLTEVFSGTLRAEAAAKAAGTALPANTTASIVQSLKGYVDPDLLAEAIKNATRIVTGPIGPRGPPGPAISVPATETTSTTVVTKTSHLDGAPTSSTTTTASSTTTSSSSTTITTQRSCTVRLDGLCL